jgi:hypothetical protein
MKDYKLRLVTAAELMVIANQGTQNVTVKVAHERAPKDIGNFSAALDFANYLDNEMLANVTSVSKRNEGGTILYGFTFDASPFESHNKPHERSQFWSSKKANTPITAREIAEEQGVPFSMVEDELLFDENESFYLVENAQDFCDYATKEEIEKSLLDVKLFVAEEKDSTNINNLVQLGYFARKSHLGTITETEKGVYRFLLSKQ